MRFLLDSNAVIAILKGNPVFRSRMIQHRSSDFGIPSIVQHELSYGAFRSQRAVENLSRLKEIQFEVVSFDREDAHEAGRVRAELAANGTPIGPYDVLIAGQAIARSLVVVTHNTREFQRVSGLQVEDWQV